MNKQFEDRRVQMDLTVVYQRKTYDVGHLLVSVGDIIGVCVQNGVVTFLAAVQELMRTTRLPVIAVRPDKDKASRLMPLAARYEQGMVQHAPANSTNHIKQLEDELTAFPNGAHDDLVDALVYCWNGLGSSASVSLSYKSAKARYR